MTACAYCEGLGRKCKTMCDTVWEVGDFGPEAASGTSVRLKLLHSYSGLRGCTHKILPNDGGALERRGTSCSAGCTKKQQTVLGVQKSP